MPFSSGSFSRVHNWVDDLNNSIDITAARMDAEFDGVATGLSTCICRDGQSTITANIPFSNFKITGLGDATAATDALNRQTADARYVVLANVTAFVQTILDDATAADVRTTIGAQTLDAELTAIAGLTSAADKLPYFTGSGTADVTTLTSFARTLLDDTAASDALTTLGAASVGGLRGLNAQTGATYTFVLTDAGKICTFTRGSAVTVTVPPNSSVAFPTATLIWVAQGGAGNVTFSPGSGVSIGALNDTLQSQYQGGVLIKIGTDEWLLFVSDNP